MPFERSCRTRLDVDARFRGDPAVGPVSVHGEVCVLGVPVATRTRPESGERKCVGLTKENTREGHRLVGECRGPGLKITLRASILSRRWTTFICTVRSQDSRSHL